MNHLLRFATLAATAVLAVSLLPAPTAAMHDLAGCVATYGFPCRPVCVEGERLQIWVEGSTTFGGWFECGGERAACSVVNQPQFVACSAWSPSLVQYTDLGYCEATYAGSTVHCWTS